MRSAYFIPGIHIVVWSLLFIVPFLVFQNQPVNTGLPHNFFIITNLYHVGLFYFNAYYLYPRLFTKKWWWLYLLTLAAIIKVSYYLKLWVLQLADPAFTVTSHNSRIIFFPPIAFIAASVIFRVITDRIQREKREKEIQAERLDSELKLLRSQISPHFLFNMMTNMVALARQKSDLLEPSLVDLIFLDIQMPGLSGLQFLQSLNRPPMVIFVTAYKDYALEGFNLNAIDYLLKPVSFERFLKACNKAYEWYNAQQKQPAQPGIRDSFFVYVEYNQVKVNIQEILYIEAMKDYVKIFIITQPKPVITKASLKAMEEKLAGHGFVRIHKSYIVSVDKITAIKRDLICIGKVELPLSESYKGEVDKLIG